MEQRVDTDSSWYDLLVEAQKETSIFLPPSLEHYVSLLLKHYLSRLDFFEEPIGIELLACATKTVPLIQYQDVGDRCLIISGLFPDLVVRKNVSQGYLKKIGKSAYYQVSLQSDKTIQPLFFHLYTQFEEISTILGHFRP